MSSPPTVAAIVPVFNARRFIDEAIRSVTSQQPTVDEVVLVDDGGTDGSFDAARAACPSALVVRTPGGCGPSTARNLAVAATQTEWLACCDHDDMWPAGRLAALVAASDGADWVVGRVRLWVEPGYTPIDSALRADGSHVPYMLSASLISRDLWNRLGGLDPTRWVGEDTDLYLRAREAGAVVRLVEQVTLVHRLHATSYTASIRETTQNSTMSAMRAATQRRRKAARGQGAAAVPPIDGGAA